MADKVPDLEIGDVVALNSGGPDMTVVKIIPKKDAVTSAPPTPAVEAGIECWWFNPIHDEGGGILQKATFCPGAVTLKKPVTPPAS